ncbi:MAG: hypothetical protein EZS28_018069 [Streblomastix strix]|uniref:Uncharacterized protein n=1 Tax=Streblomastix strix TaxID=222440 RepID=A0A5J4VV54_9EUKA|nr:MAG: hypothetical protein EZS28_018069 [Streblomastix strix]
MGPGGIPIAQSPFPYPYQGTPGGQFTSSPTPPPPSASNLSSQTNVQTYGQGQQGKPPLQQQQQAQQAYARKQSSPDRGGAPFPISSQSPGALGAGFLQGPGGQVYMSLSMLIPQAIRHRSALCLACIHKGHRIPQRLRVVVQFLKRHINNRNEAVATGALGALSNVAIIIQS